MAKNPRRVENMAKKFRRRTPHIIEIKAPPEPDSEQKRTQIKASAAAAKVLTLVELLEPILANLSFYDLLLSQAVCRTWKSVIDDSARLQQALFFHPLKEPVQLFHIPYFQRLAKPVRRPSKNTTSPLKGAVLQNPAVSRIFSDKVMNGWDLSQRAACKYYKASWRKMLVSQPPVIQLWYRESKTYANGFHGMEYTLALPPKGYESFRDVQRTNVTGLTLAELVPAYNFDNRSKGGSNSIVTITFEMKFDDRWRVVPADFCMGSSPACRIPKSRVRRRVGPPADDVRGTLDALMIE